MEGSVRKSPGFLNAFLLLQTLINSQKKGGRDRNLFLQSSINRF